VSVLRPGPKSVGVITRSSGEAVLARAVVGSGSAVLNHWLPCCFHLGVLKFECWARRVSRLVGSASHHWSARKLASASVSSEAKEGLDEGAVATGDRLLSLGVGGAGSLSRPGAGAKRSAAKVGPCRNFSIS